MNKDQRIATAYHEAGHAVIALRNKCILKEVSIVPNEEQDTLGHVISRSLPTEDELQQSPIYDFDGVAFKFLRALSQFEARVDDTELSLQIKEIKDALSGLQDFLDPILYMLQDIDPETHLEKRLQVLLAGPCAEAKFTGEFNHVGASGDFQTVEQHLLELFQSEEIQMKYIAYLESTVMHLFTKDGKDTMEWERIKRVTEALLEKETLTFQEVREIVQGC